MKKPGHKFIFQDCPQGWTSFRLGTTGARLEAGHGMISVDGVTIGFRVEREDGTCQCHPARPRIAEEGPARTAIQAPVWIANEQGSYIGEGLQEAALVSDGTLLLGVGLRFLPTDGQPLRRVGLQLELDSEFWVVAGARHKPSGGDNRLDEIGDWLIVANDAGYYGVYWGMNQSDWCERLGGEGLWARINSDDKAPFFHGWESHLRQWHGPHGWRAHNGACVTVEKDSLLLAWHERSAPAVPVGKDGLHFKGAIAVVRGSSEAAVRSRIDALREPTKPSASDAAMVGFDYLEGYYRLRRTGKKCTVTFPADPLGCQTLVRFDGEPAAAFACSVDGAAARPQLVSVGRTDDPYGPNDGRPDGYDRPVLAAHEKPAERVELAVKLSPDRPTRVEVAETEGLSLSYLSQDDRRELLLWSTRDASAPLARLSLHDLRLRDLRAPGLARPAAACLPLYWYLMNAPSPWHSANVLESWEIISNGPESVRVRLSAANPGRSITSTFYVDMKLSASGALLLDVGARLDVLGHFPVPHFQFMNLFPENTRNPGLWMHDETLAAGRDFRRAVDNRNEPKGLSRVEFSAPFFLAQYATLQHGPAGAGNAALLITEVNPEGTPCAYELCRCWLDDHFYVIFPEGGPVVGASYSVSFQAAIWADRGDGRAGALALADRALGTRRLEV